MQNLRLIFLLMMLLCQPTLATAQVLAPEDGMVSIGSSMFVLEDRSHQLNIEEVRQSTGFKPAPEGASQGLNFGYSTSVWWLRLDLKGNHTSSNFVPGLWFLELGFPLLDRVDFYGPGGEHIATGDTLPFSSRPIQDRHFVFPLKVGAGETARYYLRIESEGTLSVPLRLWRPGTFLTDTRNDYALQSAYFGVLIALTLYNLLLFISMRDAVFLLYVGFALSMGVGQLTFTGLAYQWLWPDWPNWGNIANVFGFSITGMFGMAFVRRFFHTSTHMPRFDGALIALSAVFLFCAIAVSFLPYRFASVQLSLTGLAAMVVTVLVTLRARTLRLPGAGWIIAAGLSVALGVGLVVFRNLNWLPTNFFTLYGMQMGATVEMLLVTFALGDRVTVALREKLKLQEAALDARQSLVSALQNKEVELAQRIAERTAELEQANATLRKNEATLEGLAHTDALTGLANRLLLEARLLQTQQMSQRSKRQYACLLIDLDRFKPVNDRFGHAIGDELLRQVANRLTKLARAADTVARLGGDEFVIVLSEIGGPEHASLFAGKVVSELGRTFRLLGIEVDIGASVGVALGAGSAVSLGEILRRADHAMYAAKESGRGKWSLATE